SARSSSERLRGMLIAMRRAGWIGVISTTCLAAATGCGSATGTGGASVVPVSHSSRASRPLTEVDEACQVVSRYLKADSVDARLPFVRDAGRVRSLMLAARANERGEWSVLPGARTLPRRKDAGPMVVIVPARLRFLDSKYGDGEPGTFFVVKTADG